MPAISITPWEQQTYTIGIELPIPPLPELPEVTMAVKLDLIATCPGAVYCGNPDALKNCSIGRVVGFDLSDIIPIVPFPPDIPVPKLSVSFVFPPQILIPINCPNYPEKKSKEGEEKK